MGFKVQVKKKGAGRPAVNRGAILRRTSRWASWWILGQGTFLLVLTSRLAQWTSMRWDFTSFPPQKLLGVALVALGYFLWKSLRQEGESHPWVVDTLLIYFLGCLVVELDCLRVSSLMPAEKAMFLINAAFAASLLYFREWSAGAKPAPPPTPPASPAEGA